MVLRGAVLVFVLAMIVSSLPQTAAIDLLADLVCDHDQCEADKAVEHTDRRTVAELCIDHAFTLNICVDDIGGVVNCGVVQQHNALITDIEDLTHLQDQHNDDGRRNAGERDMQALLTTVRAIDLGRIIQNLINAGKS